MKRIRLYGVLLAGCMMTGCAAGGNTVPKISLSPEATVLPTTPSAAIATASPAASLKPQGIAYVNTQYGYEFLLPDSWQGFSVAESTWEGAAVAGEKAGSVVETGPEQAIRHPLWTVDNPRQDIPILIFTLEQWDALQKEAFHIGAAPIGPSELGRNSRYVFALPARYNFAYLTGFEEVETILEGKPLKPIEPTAFKGALPSFESLLILW